MTFSYTPTSHIWNFINELDHEHPKFNLIKPKLLIESKASPSDSGQHSNASSSLTHRIAAGGPISRTFSLPNPPLLGQVPFCPVFLTRRS